MLRTFFFIGAATLLLAACETGVDTLNSDPEHRFYFYGYLDTGQDTQFVRVQRLRASADRGEPVLNEFVVSTSSDTGTERRWHDSLITLRDGTRDHLFWAAFRPSKGATEVLRIREGVFEATQSTTVPRPNVYAMGATSGGRLDLLLTATAQDPYLVPDSARVAYRLTPSDNRATVQDAFPLDPATLERDGSFKIPIGEHLQTMRKRYELLADTLQAPAATLNSVNLRSVYYSSEWKTGSNAQLPGFFGAITRDTLDIPLSNGDRATLRFYGPVTAGQGF